MAKAQALPGMERQTIWELSTAAEEYVSARDKRIKQLAKELELKEKLLELMKKHKLETYRDDELIVEISKKENVKVKSVEESESGED